MLGAVGKVLVVTGPSCVGKTDVAYEIARRHNGEVINGDKFFLYGWFNIGTGILDSLSNEDVERHLYQVLDPAFPVPSAEEYLGKVKLIVHSIWQRNKLPVIEVTPHSYAKVLAEEDGEVNPTVVGLYPESETSVGQRMADRLRVALKHGLIEETREAITRGYRDTFVMRKSFVYPPLVRFLDGLVTLDKARQKILSRSVNWALSRRTVFEDVPNMYWIEHTAAGLSRTVCKVLSKLNIK